VDLAFKLIGVAFAVIGVVILLDGVRAYAGQLKRYGTSGGVTRPHVGLIAGLGVAAAILGVAIAVILAASS
jgi:Na+/phosphate symporter